MFDVGSIVINKNLVFKETGELDHAYKKGRPCLVIAMNDEYYYYLSVSGNKNIKKAQIKLPCFTKPSTPSFKNIFKAPICYKEEIGKIPEKKMLEIYLCFIEHYENHEKHEYYDEVIEYITNYINENKKNIH